MKRKHIVTLLLLFSVLSGFSQEKFTLSGIIIDSKSGKALSGIDIVVEDKNTGTITNQKGSFLLYLDKGNYNIHISGKGYNEEEINIDLKDDIEQDVSLIPLKLKEKKPSKLKEKKVSDHSPFLSLL